MPKMKTNKSAAKRLKRTANGKIKRSKAFGAHLLTHKSAKRRRGLRKATLLSGADAARAKRLLPYS